MDSLLRPYFDLCEQYDQKPPLYLALKQQQEELEEAAEEYVEKTMVDVDEYATDPDFAEQYIGLLTQ